MPRTSAAALMLAALAAACAPQPREASQAPAASEAGRAKNAPPPALSVEPHSPPQAHPLAPETLPNKPETIPEIMPGTKKPD